ncbi:MAG: Type 1 glutamine amidotransferase-like domain-containing protein [Candidatus Lokiarchaeota archaeon]|nr:Type 1 glutamine amidotransferase-like domain-containing protein [Candidatus Lokiarchaeota archaeon]
MKRIVLFSTPYNNKNFQQILNLIFPKSMKFKRPLFMPSQGIAKTLQRYFDDWDGFAKEFNINLEYVDNSVIDTTNEKKKLRNSNILIISGGDPFQLLINLRKSGFDAAITQFTNKKEFILAGYSAGAYILTPTLKVAKIFNENYPGGKKYMSQDIIEDFSGLGIVNFEICAHYSETQHKHFLEKHIENNRNEVKLLGDNDFLVIDL